MVGKPNKKRKSIMKKMDDLMDKPCSDCGKSLEKKMITQEFEREGVKIQLSGLKAWVCKGCGETYFKPGGADKVANAANSLFELARIEEQHKGAIVAKLN